MPPKRQALGPRPRRSGRATGKRAVHNPNSPSDSFTSIKSPDNGNTKTTASSPSEAALLPDSSPPIGTETFSAMPSVTIGAETVDESVVEEKHQNSSMETQSGKISAGNETLAPESQAPEVALGIGSESEEKHSIGGSGNAEGDSLNENVVEIKPKKKTKKVVKVVKKVVRKRVPKSLHKGVAACSNPELTSEEILHDGCEKLSSGERVSLSMQEVGMVNLSERLEDKGLDKQADILDSDPSGYLPEQEVGKVDSLISSPIDVKKSDAGSNLSAQETDNPGQLVGIAMEVENLNSMNDEKDASISEIPLDSVDNEGVAPKSASGTEAPIDVVNADVVEDINDRRGAEAVGASSGYEEGTKEGSEIGNGRIVLSGELEALERRRRRRTEIFIGGLNTDAKEEDVRKVFEGVGAIVEVRLVINTNTGKNKGYAFVRYASADDAKKALEKYSKVEICGKQCATAPVEGNDTIFLGNIDKSWKNEDVIKLLQEVGIEKIDKVTVMTDPSNVGRNRGFAFLELQTYRDAQTAFKKLQKKELGKLQNIKVAWAEPLSEPDEEELLKVKSVYAEYLAPSWDEEKIRSYFIKFGEIENVVLSRNLLSSKRKDFAFINFTTREAALACIESFNHETLCDEGFQVNVKVSLAKPIPKGKPHKKVSKSDSKEISKQKQATQHHVKQNDSINKKTPVIHVSNQRKGVINSPGTAELEQVLAERALRKQMQARMGAGMANQDYSQALPGHKRSFSALGDDMNYSDPRGYSRFRMENSFPFGRPSHGEVYGGAEMASPSFYQRQGADFVLGHRYLNYSSSFQREEAPYRGIGRDYY